MELEILISPPNVTNMASFRPKFGIFRRRISPKWFFDNFTKAPIFLGGGGATDPCHDTTDL